MSVDKSGIFINSGLTVISEDVIQGGKGTLIDLMLAPYLYNNSSQNSSEDNPGVELGQVDWVLTGPNGQSEAIGSPTSEPYSFSSVFNKGSYLPLSETLSS